MAKVSASILDCNFLKLADELQAVFQAGVDAIHLDVMDGHFVPNLTFGLPIARAVNEFRMQTIGYQTIPLYSHLMVNNPEKLIDKFLPYSDFIIFHIEATERVNDCIHQIHTANKKAGLSLNPDTPIDVLKPYLIGVEDVLIMSVYPGFGGQKFILETLERIRALHWLRQESGFSFTISVDGGVNPDNCQQIIEAGADILIAGSAIFKSPNYTETVNRLKCLTS